MLFQIIIFLTSILFIYLVYKSIHYILQNKTMSNNNQKQAILKLGVIPTLNTEKHINGTLERIENSSSSVGQIVSITKDQIGFFNGDITIVKGNLVKYTFDKETILEILKLGVNNDVITRGTLKDLNILEKVTDNN